MKSCIYVIINLVNNHRYIGSAKNIDSRIRQHIHKLERNTHHSPHLQSAWNLYGSNNFIFHIIEFCKEEKLKEYEQIYLDNLKPEYNVSKDTTAPMRNRKHSEQTLQKMRGRETWNKGIPRTDQEKEFMSFRSKESYASWPEEKKQKKRQWHKDNPSRAFLGKRHTEESKKTLRKQRISGKNNKVLCLNNGVIYECQLDAAKDLGIKQGHISEICNGKRDNTNGYIFRFVDQETPTYKTSKVRVKDQNGIVYDSITLACNALNINRNAVNGEFYSKGFYERDGIKLERIDDEAYFSNFKLRHR